MGSIGLVLAIPVTTAVAVAVVKATGRQAPPNPEPSLHGEAAGDKIPDRVH